MSVGCFVVLRVRKRQRKPDLVVNERYTNDYVQISRGTGETAIVQDWSRYTEEDHEDRRRPWLLTYSSG